MYKKTKQRKKSKNTKKFFGEQKNNNCRIASLGQTMISSIGFSQIGSSFFSSKIAYIDLPIYPSWTAHPKSMP